MKNVFSSIGLVTKTFQKCLCLRGAQDRDESLEWIPESPPEACAGWGGGCAWEDQRFPDPAVSQFAERLGDNLTVQLRLSENCCFEKQHSK